MCNLEYTEFFSTTTHVSFLDLIGWIEEESTIHVFFSLVTNIYWRDGIILDPINLEKSYPSSITNLFNLIDNMIHFPLPICLLYNLFNLEKIDI